MKEFTVSDNDAGLRVDQWCKLHLPMLPYMLTQKLLRKGDIKINKRKTDAKARVEAGDVIAVYANLDAPPPTTNAPTPSASRKVSQKLKDELERWIIYENKHCFVLNKPAGIAVQGGSGIKDSVDGRLDALCDEHGQRPRLVHRIDRDTSGILLLAKNREDAAQLTDAFRDKQAKKIYWALVVGVPDEPIGTIDLPLGKRAQDGGIEKMSVVVDENDGQDAITHYRVVQSFGGRLSWLELRPVTGRTHQLRVHLNAIGHPIYGDGKYAGQRAFVTQPPLPKQLHLHARYLEIMRGDYRIRATAPLPWHMMESWEQLNFHADDDGVSLLEIM
jgi:23S rRNA pseudouridine955/2504/2580 synthase